jgi:hypothetical protein
MAAEVTENYVDPGDTRNDVLETLAEHLPWVFIVCRIDLGGAIDLKVDCGGGIPDAATIRNLLQKTLDALPE